MFRIYASPFFAIYQVENTIKCCYFMIDWAHIFFKKRCHWFFEYYLLNSSWLFFDTMSDFWFSIDGFSKSKLQNKNTKSPSISSCFFLFNDGDETKKTILTNLIIQSSDLAHGIVLNGKLYSHTADYSTFSILFQFKISIFLRITLSIIVERDKVINCIE